ncbi:MAG: response regulator [bacterium]
MYLILAADDDPSFSVALKEFLESRGYLVEQASSGIEASEKAQQLRPCLIILDMQMPVTYGSSVYDSLQRQEATRNIPVIFLSGFPVETIKKAVPSSANVKVVHKSADWRPLEQAIHELLKDKPL